MPHCEDYEKSKPPKNKTVDFLNVRQKHWLPIQNVDNTSYRKKVTRKSQDGAVFQGFLSMTKG
jgi:hypothetical protein